MRERWDEAINKIDEKYIAEAAQAHAKATEKRISEEEYELEGSRPKVMQMPTMAKKSRKPFVIGACAAAVGLAVLAGIHFGKGNDLLPQDTLTDEVTSETGETSETNEIVEVKEDGAIEFSCSYQEGRIEFAKPLEVISTGADVTVASPIDVFTQDELFSYIKGFAALDVTMMDENLTSLGYTLNYEKSHWNGTWDSDSMPAGDSIGQQVTLCYTKGDSVIKVNIGETGENFGYARTPGGYAVRTDGTAFSGDRSARSELKNYDGNGTCFFSAAGAVSGGLECYCAQINAEIDIFVSTCGASLDEYLSTLSGLICHKRSLEPVYIEPFDKTDYTRFEIVSGDYTHPLPDTICEQLFVITDTFSDTQGIYDPYEFYEGTSSQLLCYRDGSSEPDVLQIGMAGAVQDGFGYLLSDGDSDVSAYFGITEEAYSELIDFLEIYAPYGFYAEVLAEDDLGNTSDPDSGGYLLRDNNGSMYEVHYDELFEIGSSVEVCIYGFVMETYPARINVISIEPAYNIDADDAPVLTDDMQDRGFDTAIFEQYFCGRFGLDYRYPECVEKPVCFEGEDGFHLAFYNEVAAEVWFLPRGYTDKVFIYYVDSLDTADYIEVPERSDYSWYQRIKEYNTSDTDLEEGGYINGFGEQKLAAAHGGNLAEIIAEIKSDITTENGQQWKYHVTNLIPNRLKYFNNAQQSPQRGDTAYFIARYATQESYDEYWANNDENALYYQHFLYIVEFVDGKYVITSREKCTQTGESMYDIDSDTTPVVTDVGINGFDIGIYEDYFFGSWTTTKGTTDKIDYTSYFHTDAKCNRTQDGYVLSWLNSATNFGVFFIHESDLNTMYAYQGYPVERPQRHEYDEVLTRTDDFSTDIKGKQLNVMGEYKLFSLMGEEFIDVYDKLCSEDFDDFTISPRENFKRTLVNYATGAEPFAQVIVRYTKPKYYFASSDERQTHYIKHTLRFVDDKWQVTESIPCDENGVVSLYNMQYNKTTLATHTSEFGGYDIYLSYYEEETDGGRAISEPLLYCIQTYVNYQNEEITAHIRPYFEVFGGSGGIIPAEGEILFDNIQTDGCDLIAVYIPTLDQDNRLCYAVSFFRFDAKSDTVQAVSCTEDIVIAAPQSAGSVVIDRGITATTLGENHITFMDISGKPMLYSFDSVTLTLNRADIVSYFADEPVVDYAAAEYGNNELMELYFGGTWWGADEFSIELSDDTGCYETDSGAVLIDGDMVMYVSRHEMNFLFVFDNVADGEVVDLSDATVYRKARNYNE